jgi:hypothetical integral membrane protein (TIGR02206 family)
MPAHFHSFGASHWTAMTVMFAAAAALIAVSRAAGNLSFDKALRWTLAGFLLADWAAYLAMFYVNGWLALGNVLPLNLCDWATITVVVTLLAPNQTSYELSYFWALAGTLLASITPDLEYDFPDTRFIFFFFYHAIIITSVLYLTFALRMRPVEGSIRRVILWTLSYRDSGHSRLVARNKLWFPACQVACRDAVRFHAGVAMVRRGLLPPRDHSDAVANGTILDRRPPEAPTIRLSSAPCTNSFSSDPITLRSSC